MSTTSEADDVDMTRFFFFFFFKKKGKKKRRDQATEWSTQLGVGSSWQSTTAKTPHSKVGMFQRRERSVLNSTHVECSETVGTQVIEGQNH